VEVKQNELFDLEQKQKQIKWLQTGKT